MLIAVRWALPDRAFRDLEWILVVAAVPFLPWLLAYARTIFTTVKVAGVELTFAESKAATASAERIQAVNDPVLVRQGVVSFTQSMTSRVVDMTRWIEQIRAQRVEVVPVDLGAGNRWLLPNLYLLSLLLEVKTVVTRLVFTEARDGKDRAFVGSCSPFELRLALDQR